MFSCSLNNTAYLTGALQDSSQEEDRTPGQTAGQQERPGQDPATRFGSLLDVAAAGRRSENRDGESVTPGSKAEGIFLTEWRYRIVV